jgi:Zn-dependent protease with chaperone function
MQRLIVTRPMRALAVAALAGVALASAGAFAKEKVETNDETMYLARDFVFVDSQAIETYLRGICQRLLDAKGLKTEVPRILVQSSDAFNAFSDANHNLVISTGALRAMESEDELAALLGHELSHLILEHPQDKDIMKSLPLGVETMASIRDAAAELKGQKASYSSDLTKFDPEHLSDSQATSVLWSDFIAPSWNRKQEREADENGFELMRAAGYDPSAFGQLFAKLQAAEAKRTERMKVLKKALVVRLREAGANTSLGTSGGRPETVALARDVKTAVTDDASEKFVDGLSVFNRSYDAPDERQAALATYAREHREKKRVPHPEAGLKDALQSGDGGALLILDAAAIGTMDALAARNSAAAKQAVQGLGSEEAKQPSAHLNLALGSYHQLYGNPEVGERSARAWVQSARAPAQAFTWAASFQAKRRDYSGAIETLESGRKRVGASTPFLPNLVAMARASGNMPLAREYTRECQAESNSNLGDKLQSLVSEQAAPKGLYAECVRQLGEKPQKDVIAEAVKDKTRDLGKKLFKLN